MGKWMRMKPKTLVIQISGPNRSSQHGTTGSSGTGKGKIHGLGLLS